MKYNKQEKRLLKVLEEFDLINILKKHNAVIMGGAIVSVFNGTKINDYDIYCKSVEESSDLCNALTSEGFFNKVTTENAYTLLKNDKKKNNGETLVIQIIKNEKFCNYNVEDTFHYFDFTVCMGAYDVAEKKFILHDNFLIDNLQKNLVFNPGTEYPICSLYRTKKYQDKGFNLSGKEIIKMALTINKLKIETYADLKRQLNGIDTMYLTPITESLERMKSKDYNKEEFLEFFNQWTCGDELSDELAEKYLGGLEEPDHSDEEFDYIEKLYLEDEE